MEDTLSVRKIMHYIDAKFMGAADEKMIRDSVNDGPIVVFQSYEGKHVQVKVSPFNAFNQSKEELSFVDKMQYYRKKTTSRMYQPKEETISEPNYAVLSEIISNYFDLRDGTEQEMAEFNQGISQPIYTGFENDYDGFFVNKFVDFNSNALSAFVIGIQGL